MIPGVTDNAGNRVQATPVVLLDATGGTSGSAASPQYVASANLTPKGYQQITSATLATSTALTVPSGATVAIIQNNGTQPVRFRDDGVAPTSTTGQRLIAGAYYTYDGSLPAIRFIYEVTGAILDVTYYA